MNESSNQVPNEEPKNNQDNIFPIVGIGAPEGGLEALTQLLSYLPVNTGMAFVLIQHLASNQESPLSMVLSQATQMPVSTAQDGMVIRPNQVYIIPHNARMIIAPSDVLRLTPRTRMWGRLMSIDAFLISLAAERGNKAIGVTLLGNNGDGARGLQEIKAAGGITLTQENASGSSGNSRAQVQCQDRARVNVVNSIPKTAAVVTHQVDFVLPLQGIAKKLAEISSHPYFIDSSPTELNREPSNIENTLQIIFSSLQGATGVNFTQYKRTILQRRLERRMTLHKLKRLEQYTRYLQEYPAEAIALHHDLLIQVSSFFRDPGAFEALKRKVFPTIIAKDKSLGAPIRIWVAGCATGEEAYSIAICLSEFLAEQEVRPSVQIYATDVSETAIQKARRGIYSFSQVANVSPERLERFFVPVEGGYRIGKAVRDQCIFARQNLISDPPFSQLDLISCRNVLSFWESSLQKKLLQGFHYGLTPTGFLLLGTSETIHELGNLFALVDKKHKIYSRKTAPIQLSMELITRNSPIAAVPGSEDVVRSDLELQSLADRTVLNQYAPVGVIIDSDLQILQFRGQLSSFLEPAPGRASLNLLKMVKAELRVELRSAIYQAKKQEVAIAKSNLQLKEGEQVRQVRIHVVPLKAPRVGEGYFLVLFEKSLALVPSSTEIAGASHCQLRPDQVTSNEQEITRLRQELTTTKEELAGTKKYLQAIIEEQEATNQELRIANTEILASNEELQSTNEELETAKEEIQVTNEELTTVNSELHRRNIEANQVSNDLQNLLSSTNIPMLMLGRELIIRRFTPSAQSIFNIIPTDMGRPLGDINHNLNLPDLEAQVLEVIHTLSVKEQEVQDQKGHWYELQIRPYRTHNNQIDGAVLLLQNITQRKLFEEQRHQLLVQEQKARKAAETANRAKDEFLSIISHELRSPLNSVIGWSQLLRQQSFDTAQIAHALEMIENAAKLQAKLIEDLLDTSQLSRVSFQLNTRSIDLVPVIEAAIAFARPLAEAKNQQMEAVLERNPLFVAGDAQRLQQVMGNLLSNAIKFTPAGGKVTVKLERAETLAQIWVSDTGQGISAKFLPHVFERFTQADGSRTRAKGGLGLGLAIVRHLVECHRGTVSATSPGEGQGATFLVQLPLLIESQEVGKRAAIASPEPLAPSSLNRLHILVVDDDPGILELLKIILEQIAQVTAVTSAAEAIALLNANPGKYNLLLSDIGMPQEDGYTLIRQVRALGADFRRIPAVALTAYVGEEEPSEALAAGFQKYVPKPVEPVQLVSVITELVKAAPL